MATIFKCDIETRFTRLMRAFNGELGTAYELFEYRGHQSATAVLIVFGTVESSVASQVAANLAKSGTRVGVVSVRVYRPFVEEAFLNALPSSVQTIAVLGQVQDAQAVADQTKHSNLYTAMLAAV